MTSPLLELDVRLPLARFPLAVRAAIAGDAVAVLGPSGAGKTSLLEVIAGLRRATGRLSLAGEVLLDSAAGVDRPPERRRVGYVPQDAGLFPHLDVRANVRFGLRRDPEAERRFAESIEMLALASLLDRHPATLSGGERQRVALARALASAPRLLVLDEPLAALDRELKARILPYLLAIRDEARVPLVYVTHNVGEALLLAREALVLKDGAVLAHGPAERVLGAGGHAGALATLDPDVRFDNVIAGTIAAVDEAAGIAHLAIADGLHLAVPAPAGATAGRRAAYAVPAEDVLVSIHPLAGISARNILAGQVTALDAIGRDAIVGISAAGRAWRARLTPAAARELGLAPGLPVWIAIKTHAFRRLE